MKIWFCSTLKTENVFLLFIMVLTISSNCSWKILTKTGSLGTLCLLYCDVEDVIFRTNLQ